MTNRVDNQTEIPFTELPIPAVLHGERLDRVVALLCNCSRTVVAELVHSESVLLNGKVAKASTRVGEGTISVRIPSGEVALPAADPDVQFEVVHEDADCFVINKPAGLVVHPAPGAMDHTLVNGLLAIDPEIASVGQEQRPGIVHRLDRDTSGLMVVARNERAYAALVAALAAHEVVRSYAALVYGIVEDDQGVIDAPIGRDARQRTRMAVRKDGREARTAFEVLCRTESPQSLTALRCELETGRTHQIRVHFAAIRHPVLADRTYAARRPTYGLDRTFLHSQRLEFAHPVTQQHLQFAAALPPELCGWMERNIPDIAPTIFLEA